MMPAQDKSDGEQTDLLHLEKYLKSSTNVALKTCLQMTILPQTKYSIQQEVVYNSRRTEKIDRLNMVSSRHPYIYNTEASRSD